MRHILSILLENEPGALSRVSGLFSARGYNIESLTVAPTEDLTMSRMTIVTTGSDEVIEQITKQLNKLIEVVKVVDLTEGNHIERELMLERQAEGIELAKRRGAYKGRKPTAMAKGREVLALAKRGLPRAEIARQTGISISSVQRILRTTEK